MSFIKTLVAKAPRIIAKATFAIKKASPTILVVAGTVGVIAGTVVACEATKKIPETTEDYDKAIELVKTSGLDPKEYRKELTGAYFRKGWAVTKLYLPAVAIEVASLGMIFASYGILSSRSAKAIAAYSSLEAMYNNYDKRVADKYGKEEARKLRLGIDEKEIDIPVGFDEDGNVITEKKLVQVKDTMKPDDPTIFSPYAVIFDELNPNFHKGLYANEENRIFLTNVQNWANDQFHRDGYLFLNDVLWALGFDKKPIGQLVGWTDDRSGDGFVDFGFMNEHSKSAVRFCNNMSDGVILDFNVDGVIYDKLDKFAGRVC